MKDDDNNGRRRGRATVLGLLVVVSIVVAASRADGRQASEAGIVGQVTDESGAVLPGVTVTATSPSLQVPSVVVATDERGEYRIAPVPIGTYVVSYELSGFQGVRRADLRLTVGFTARVNIVLKVGTLDETITVSGASPVVDASSTAATTQFTRENLELTVSSRNGLTTLLSLTPGVRTTLDVGGSANTEQPVFRAFGQSGEPWTMLEGVATTTMQGTGGNGQYFDYNTYEEARVSTLANDAETPTRGIQVVSVVKSGSNDFHGSLFGGRHLLAIQADNIDDELRAQGVTRGNPILSRYDMSADVGGRILTNRLWFYGALRQRNNVHEISNCYVENSIDLDDGSPCLKAQPIWFHTEKLSAQVNAANRLVFFNQWTRKWDMDGSSEFIAWESRNNDVTYPRTMKGEWSTVLSDSMVAQVQFGGFQFRGIYYTNDHGPYIDREPGTGSIGTSTRDIFSQQVSGEVLSAGQRVFERHLHAKANLTWYKPNSFKGNHELKTGIDYFIATNSRGQIERETSSLQLVFNNGAAYQIQTLNAPNSPKQDIDYVGVYVKDEWAVNQRLTLNLGARFAYDNGRVPESCYSGSAFYGATCYETRQFVVFNSIAPRLHFSFDVTGDSRTVVKGGWGRFDHMRQLSELQSADPNSNTTRTYRWLDPNGNRQYDPGEVDLNPNGPAFVSQSGGSNTVPSADELQPKSDEFSASIERELMSNFAIRMTGIYSRYMSSFRLVNALRPYDSYSIPVTRPDPGGDGRVGTADDPGATMTYWEFPANLAGRAFEQFMLTNETDLTPSYTSFEIATSKRMSKGWMAMASYSATKKNVPYVNGLNPSQSASSVQLAALDPNSEIFAADNSWESVGKLTGAYLLPYEVMVSANYEYRSGVPWARQVQFTGGATIPSIVLRVEPIGSQQLPAIHLTNARVQKRFSMSASKHLEVRANIYNMFNANTVLGVNMRSGPSYLVPTSILEPRILELSASFIF